MTDETRKPTMREAAERAADQVDIEYDVEIQSTKKKSERRKLWQKYLDFKIFDLFLGMSERE